MMADNIIVISYKIIGMGRHDAGKGYVAIFLEPTEKLQIEPEKSEIPGVEVHGFGPGGSPIPKHIQHQMVAMIKESMPGLGSRQRDDPRTIVLIESVVDFIPRNWKFGDIVNVSFEKVKDAAAVAPKEFEE